MGAPSRAARKTTAEWKTTPPPSGRAGGEPGARPGAVTSDSTRAAVFLGVVALVLRFGEDVPITALATPIIIVAGVILLVLVLTELRAYRRWTLH